MKLLPSLYLLEGGGPQHRLEVNLKFSGKCGCGLYTSK